MERRTLGRTDLSVSIIGFGAAELGLQNIDRNEAITILNCALDYGVNVIDTAECYNDSEELIGCSISHRRSEFFLFTKCGHSNKPDEHWRPETIRLGLERSLRRLKVDAVDLLQLHSCPIELLKDGSIIDMVEGLRQEGKTRFIGCSADGRAAAYAIGTGRFDVLQTSLSVADQDALAGNLAAASRHEMGVIVKRPIANAVWRHPTRPADPWLHDYWDRISALDYDFLKSPGPDQIAVALRFALSPPEVSTAIVGTTNLVHLQNNIGCIGSGRLEQNIYDAIIHRWQSCGGEKWPAKG